MLGTSADIGKIAAPAAGNADLLTCFPGVIHQQDATAAMRRTHQPRRAGAQYDRIVSHASRMPE